MHAELLELARNWLSIAKMRHAESPDAYSKDEETLINCATDVLALLSAQKHVTPSK